MTAQITRYALGIFLLTASSISAVQAEWSVPAEFEDRINGLDEVQARFIKSGAVLDFIPEQQLQHELRARDDADLQRLLDDLLGLAGQMGYDAERDMGAIPLNLASRRFNGPLATPEPLRDSERSAGPFSVHRYQFPQSGVPTFGGAKVAVWPEDLVAGGVDVAIIGVPSDMSSGRRDAAWAPNAMRAMNTIANTDPQSLVEPFEVLTVVDYGDFAADNLSAERTAKHVSSMVAETAATGVIPMLVGGDTSILYPAVAGVAEHRGAGTFGLLHFSAHADADRFNDHTVSDRRAVFAILEQGLVRGADTVQLGLRGPALDAPTLEWLRAQRVRYHTMAEIQEKGLEKVLKKVLSEVDRGPDQVFVSVDVSVIEPAEMVAAGRIENKGLSVTAVTGAIREVCASKTIVGFEITDLAPMLDLSRLSVINANALLNACLAGMAVKRAGLEPDFVHPLVLDHGQR